MSTQASKDIIVLTPNGRRQKVHCSPDTTMLQVLEDVCQKQGFQAAEYNLKHYNTMLDLSSTIRFSNLPNKATVEMVETDHKREETIVTIGLQLEDGERRTADFSPNTSLFELVTSLAPVELNSIQQPTILYMRQEVIGLVALRSKTLRQLGLMNGRAILRLLNKAEEVKQANVSAVYRRPLTSEVKQPFETIPSTNTGEVMSNQQTLHMENLSVPGPSNVNHSLDIVSTIRKEKIGHTATANNKDSEEDNGETNLASNPSDTPMETDLTPSSQNSNIATLLPQENLERRLKIEDEVTFLGEQKAIAFIQPDDFEGELDDLPDDFYDLTVEEVRRIYNDLQHHRMELENLPLLTVAKREEINKQASMQRLSVYKNVVVRIQFPDQIILQGIFTPSNTIEDVTNFIKEYLYNPGKPFHIFTSPLKEELNCKMTLLEARFVPCVHMHFRWLEDGGMERSLREEVYTKTTPSDAARILASKYRAPSRRKGEEASASASRSAGTSSAGRSSSMPKWFKK